mmetsp:Transcript_10023/g.18845  ORF Transcript_10023/g.18845 Transcript_10023/m.18845 type:complete len:317 (-) Transcript_10023:355-1305(-)
MFKLFSSFGTRNKKQEAPKLGKRYFKTKDIIRRLSIKADTEELTDVPEDHRVTCIASPIGSTGSAESHPFHTEEPTESEDTLDELVDTSRSHIRDPVFSRRDMFAHREEAPRRRATSMVITPKPPIPGRPSHQDDTEDEEEMCDMVLPGRTKSNPQMQVDLYALSLAHLHDKRHPRLTKQAREALEAVQTDEAYGGRAEAGQQGTSSSSVAIAMTPTKTSYIGTTGKEASTKGRRASGSYSVRHALASIPSRLLGGGEASRDAVVDMHHHKGKEPYQVSERRAIRNTKHISKGLGGRSALVLKELTGTLSTGGRDR